MIKRLMFISFLALSCNVFADTSTPPSTMENDLSGTYTCKGMDPESKTDQKAYQDGILKITKKSATYDLSWNFKHNGTAGEGVGFLMPSDSATASMLAVGFRITTGPYKNKGGVIVYKVSNGTLEGNWARQDRDQLGQETCTKSS